LDIQTGLRLFIIDLDHCSLKEALQAQVDYDNKVGLISSAEKTIRLEQGSVCLRAVVSLLLYICSQNADFGDKRPVRPQVKKIKNGLRMFAAEKPTVWEMGFRLGAAIRQYSDVARISNYNGIHHSPRPHIRRAHWHSYWKGKRDDENARKIVVKWIPPIPVNVAEGDITTTIHAVERNTQQEHLHRKNSCG
jgi:hypothetical protein